MAYVGGIYWRLTNFIDNSVSFDTLSDPEQAYEAAVQFGRLNRLLSDFDASELKETIPGFHDLGLRYNQFAEAHEHTNESLKLKAAPDIILLSSTFLIHLKIRPTSPIVPCTMIPKSATCCLIKIQ